MITLGVTMILFAISTSFLPLQQFSSAQPMEQPTGTNMTGGNMTGTAQANPVGTSHYHWTGKTSPEGANMTGNMTGNMTSFGEPGTPAANPAGIAPSRGPQDKFLTDEPELGR